MASLESMENRLQQMATGCLRMWQGVYRVLMEHDADLIPAVLAEEEHLNRLEKEVSREVAALGTASAEEKGRASIYVDIVGDLELIGDYCKDILERLEIKIAENMMFSDDAIKEYEELYHRTEAALQEVVNALHHRQACFIQPVSQGQGHIDAMVDEYRKRHNQRLLAGVCSPIACNMFLNMLDFTAAVYYHTKKIARNVVRLYP